MSHQRLPRTWRDIFLIVLDVLGGLLLASGVVLGVLIEAPLLVALTVAVGAATFLLRRMASLDVELTDRNLDLAHGCRELAACEAELAEACDELAHRDPEGDR